VPARGTWARCHDSGALGFPEFLLLASILSSGIAGFLFHLAWPIMFLVVLVQDISGEILPGMLSS
jgi:hypothetical protein